MTSREDLNVQTISIVVPVYQGEFGPSISPRQIELSQHLQAAFNFRASEVILVHDGAIDCSDAVMSSLAARLPFVLPAVAQLRPACSNVSCRARTGSYRSTKTVSKTLPISCACLKWPWRRMSSLCTPSRPTTPRLGAEFLQLHGQVDLQELSWSRAYRRIQQFPAHPGRDRRGLAAYCWGAGVYLDVALSWVVAGAALCPVTPRTERGRPSGYSSTLANHFWTMVLTSGSRLAAVSGVHRRRVSLPRGGCKCLHPVGKLTGRVRSRLGFAANRGQPFFRPHSVLIACSPVSGSRSQWRWASHST